MSDSRRARLGAIVLLTSSFGRATRQISSPVAYYLRAVVTCRQQRGHISTTLSFSTSAKSTKGAAVTGTSWRWILFFQNHCDLMSRLEMPKITRVRILAHRNERPFFYGTMGP